MTTRFFSTPGRVEIGGNHTDHQHGRVLAAAINLEIRAEVSACESRIARITSAGFDSFDVDFTDLAARESEIGTSAAIVRGVARWFEENGHNYGGFNCVVSSDIPGGVGLSSSAAFEVLIGNIIKGLYCADVSAIDIALAGKFAENVYFGKPCGLMDQIASSVGGLMMIDFLNPFAPVVTPLSADFSGYELCVVETGDDHADLTEDYVTVTNEMKLISQHFGCEVLRDVEPELFYSSISELRCFGERAIVRAMHIFEENERVLRQVSALKSGDVSRFLRLVTESGRSSTAYLQNIYSQSNPTQQGVSLALALCERILGDLGAFRVHGGGFGGTVLAFVPSKLKNSFKAQMNAVFGEYCCHFLSVNENGGRETSQVCPIT